jgi:hypothetical protein
MLAMRKMPSASVAAPVVVFTSRTDAPTRGSPDRASVSSPRREPTGRWAESGAAKALSKRTMGMT